VSSLVAQHFRVAQPAGKPTVEAAAAVKAKETASAAGDEALKAQLEEKLALLDAQIARFKRENEACRVQREEQDKQMAALEQERQRNQETLRAERTQLYAELDDERAKLKRERKRFEQEREKWRADMGSASRAEDVRAEMESKLQTLAEEKRQVETRLKRQVERLTRQVQELTKQLEEKREEAASAERSRLDEWDRRDKDLAAAAKKRPLAPPDRGKNKIEEPSDVLQDITTAANLTEDVASSASPKKDDDVKRRAPPREIALPDGRKEPPSQTAGEKSFFRTGSRRSSGATGVRP
jgi:chromosome segregation ATPase